MIANTNGFDLDSLPGPDDITRHELDNGLVVLVRENHTTPTVVMEGMLRSGSIFVPREQAGLARFSTSMLMRGTKSRDFAALHEEIEGVGASLDFSAGTHTTGFGSSSLAEDLGLMLTLAADVLRNPTFPAEHVEKVRGEILTGLERRAHDTRRMAALTFNELAYPNGHPYGVSKSGYIDTVRAITRDQLVDFHQRHVGPREGILVIVGAVNTDEVLALIQEALGDWENPDQPDSPPPPDAARIEEARQQHVSIPGKTQSDVMLGMPGPARSAPDFQAAQIANSILGVFGLMGRLGDNVRERQGLAYYSFSRLTGGIGPGPWYVSAGVSPDNVEKAIASIRDEVRRIVDEPVTADELAENKANFKGRVPLQLETNGGVAGTITNMELHQLGLDYLRNYAAMIDAITVEDVQAAARAYLDPDAYALAVAGPDGTE